MGDADNGAPAALTPSNQTSLLANFTFCQTFTASESQMLERHIRNLTIGLLGIVANFAAVAIVTKTKKIKSPLKIYLTSLTVNDIIFMTVLILPTWKRASLDLTCTILAIGSVSSFAVANLMVALISFHNYQAVFNAVKFRLVSTRTVSLAVAVVWLLGWSLGLMCIGSIKPQHGECRPPLKLPKFVYFLGGAFSAVSAVFVLVLNFRVIYFIKSSSQVTPSLSISSPVSLTETAMLTGTVVLTSVVSTRVPVNKAQLVTPANHSYNKLSNDRDSNKSLHTLDITHNNAEHPLPTIPFNIFKGQGIHWRGHDSTKMQTLAAEVTPAHLNMTFPGEAQHYQDIISLRVRSDSSRHESPVLIVKSLSTNANPHLLRNNTGQRDVQLSNIGSQESHDQCRVKNYIPRINAQISRSLTRNSRHLSVRSVRMRKVCVTLCIITLWCCSLNLPNFVHTMISVSLDSGREKLEGSAFSLVSTTMVLVNCLSQPIIYVWRFVDWSRVSFKLRYCQKR